MNRVLAAERNSQAQLVEARTKAEVEQIQAQSRAEATRCDAEAEADARRVQEHAQADAVRAKAEAETQAYAERVKAADVLEEHPALLRLAELETLRELASNANARLYLGIDRGRVSLNGDESTSRGA